ncbi:MAG: enolase C-terminal domain-like protein [Pararhizobium sp.]
MVKIDAPVAAVRAAAYKIPTDAPESDGTLKWSSTTMVTVEIDAGGKTGFGFSYVHDAAAVLVAGKLADVLKGRDAFAIRESWQAMQAACRNLGRPGIGACAISACDIALHDLVGKLADMPTAVLLGLRRPDVEIYGSGGFTAYDDAQLESQLGGWAASGMKSVKMKVGRDPAADPARVRTARSAIGPGTALMVDANGAYARKQALALAEIFEREGVIWFEEPVSSDDLEGLRLLRDRVPPGMEVAAGEYGYDPAYFRGMIDAGAVDVLQADATRCLGHTGYLVADALAQAAQLPLSSHCGPAIHLPCAMAALRQRHMEWFHDHVRIERMLLDGAPQPKDGKVAGDLSRPGIGLALKATDAEQFRVR